MRKLYLHIGCGKTGSSALQVWLANNRQHLLSQHIVYPFPTPEKLGDYAITSGNGLELVQRITNGTVEPILADIMQRYPQDILYSSEIFQTLDDDRLAHLQTLAERLKLEVHIIAFVRDVYDMAYSTYLQHLKRHGYDQTFRVFGLTQTTLMQFQVVERFAKYFKNIRLLHYDTEKVTGLEKALCRCLGVDPAVLPPMSEKKVNRSLTYFESQLLLLCNTCYKQQLGPAYAETFCTIISDMIIGQSPERPTEIFYDAAVHEHFQRHMGEFVATFNRVYFHDAGLSIFNPAGKTVIRDPSPLSEELSTLIKALFRGFAYRLDKTPPAVAFREKMIETLRDTALSLEDTAVNQAYFLMRAAQHFRRNGPLINQKVREYGARLNAAKAAPPPVPGKS
ncbi:MAG: hypothetical protein RDU30_11055 [Desulfovibrionaceae bacterium]|nr:hypothetical protein [Desulfovibrionaceae bacterium]